MNGHFSEMPDASAIMQTARLLNDGETSPFLPDETGGILVHVEKHEPIDDAKYKAEKARLAEQVSEIKRGALFQEWIKHRKAVREGKRRLRCEWISKILFDDANGDLALGELEAAVEKYARCVELDPEFFDGWHALGMAQMKLGHFPEAIAAGLKTVALAAERSTRVVQPFPFLCAQRPDPRSRSRGREGDDSELGREDQNADTMTNTSARIVNRRLQATQSLPRE